MRTPRTGPHACSIPRKSAYAGQWRASGRLTLTYTRVGHVPSAAALRTAAITGQ